MIKALIFDCFGVFYIDPVLAYTQKSTTPQQHIDALETMDEQAARGKLSKQGFVAQTASLLGISEVEADRRFFFGKEQNKPLVHLVRELRKQYKTALLSNIGGDMMDGFFSPQERRELFDVVVLSGDVHMAKPEKEIFELTCGRLGVELDEAVMIDDSENTCKVVKTFGMPSVCYKNFEQCKADLAEHVQLPLV